MYLIKIKFLLFEIFYCFFSQDFKDKNLSLENEKQLMEVHIIRLSMTNKAQQQEIEKIHQILEERKIDRENLIIQVFIYLFIYIINFLFYFINFVFFLIIVVK